MGDRWSSQPESQDYHITPEQAAQLANDARAKLLVFYHLLPAPDGVLPGRVFAQGIDEARRGGWTIADDGSLYTMPLGSDDVQIGPSSSGGRKDMQLAKAPKGFR